MNNLQAEIQSIRQRTGCGIEEAKKLAKKQKLMDDINYSGIDPDVKKFLLRIVRELG